MPIFDAESLRDISTRIFLAAGATIEEASVVSDLLVKSELAGHESHGIIRIIQYVEAIEKGEIVPRVEAKIERETASSALLNGNHGFGQVVAKKAMEIAIRKAEMNSTGTVCAFNLYHIGRLADYTTIAAQKDMVGIAMVNSIKRVAPYGGAERLLSTSPLSYAFPTHGRMPFVLDIATSMCAEGKIRVALHKDNELPDGYIIDKNGNPSNRPQDLYDGGALLPLGGDSAGYKGFGLGLIVEVLSGILSGDGCSYEERKSGNGIFFQAINIEDFICIELFKERINNLIRTIKASRLRPGFSEILIPGELESREQERKLKEGINVSNTIWKQVVNLSKRLGLNI